MPALRQDLTLAARLFRRNPGFTAVATLTLAIGIGANASILSLADATFLRTLDIPDADRVVHVFQRRTDIGPYPLSLPDYFYYREHTRSFERLAAHYPTSPLHTIIGDEPAALNGAVVTASYFDVLQLQPELGRWFSAEEDRVRGRDSVAIISERLWERRFGRDSTVIGTMLPLNGRPFSIVGVMPRSFKGVHARRAETDVWMPSAMFDVGYRFCDAFDRGCTIIQLLGRLRHDTSPIEAQRELDVLARQLESAYPSTNAGLGLTVVPARGLGFGPQPAETEQLRLFLLAVGIVLFIACANIAGLLLARAVGRRREIAVRIALGARRSRLVRQLLTESVALAMLGGTLGLLFAIWGNDLLESLYAQDGAGRPLDFDVSLRPLAIVSTLGLTALAALASGLLPALHGSQPGVAPVLKDEGTSGGAARARLRQVLVTAQVAMSVMLLVAAALVVQSLHNVMAGPGFDPRSIALVRLRPSLIGLSYERAQAYQREVIDRLAALPGVVSASPSEFLPLVGAGRPAGVSLRADSREQDVHRVIAGRVGARFFETLRIPIVEGREFTERDYPQAPRVAVLNDVLARRLWPNSNATSRTLLVDGQRYEVVGVVRDAQYYAFGEAARPQLFLSYWQPNTRDAFGKDSRMHIRVAGDAPQMMSAIRRAVAAVDPNVPISEDYPLSDRVAYMYQSVRMARTLLVSLGAVALFLSAVGLYGVLAFSVSQRTREIGIRVALGAGHRSVARLIMGEGLRVGLIGAVAGVAGAWMSARFVSGLLYGIDTHDPLAFVAAPLILLAVAVAAAYLPARRAANIPAVAALRRE
jgi:predicted permease